VLKRITLYSQGYMRLLSQECLLHDRNDRDKKLCLAAMFAFSVSGLNSGVPTNTHAWLPLLGPHLTPLQRSRGASKAKVNSDDYYEVLGVGRKATKKEIKKAYRTLALKVPSPPASTCLQPSINTTATHEYRQPKQPQQSTAVLYRLALLRHTPRQI
jgi:hypothetical protein